MRPRFVVALAAQLQGRFGERGLVVEVLVFGRRRMRAQFGLRIHGLTRGLE